MSDNDNDVNEDIKEEKHTDISNGTLWLIWIIFLFIVVGMIMFLPLTNMDIVLRKLINILVAIAFSIVSIFMAVNMTGISKVFMIIISIFFTMTVIYYMFNI